jgi:hypothetical protein
MHLVLQSPRREGGFPNSPESVRAAAREHSSPQVNKKSPSVPMVCLPWSKHVFIRAVDCFVSESIGLRFDMVESKSAYFYSFLCVNDSTIAWEHRPRMGTR